MAVRVDEIVSGLPAYGDWHYSSEQVREPMIGNGDLEGRVSDTFVLPSPSFSPPLGFSPEEFPLPPAYEDVVDIEKAWIPEQPTRIFDASLLSWPVSSGTSDHRNLDLTFPPSSLRIVRYTRSIFFAVYQRVFTLVLVINAVPTLILYRSFIISTHASKLNTLAVAASANLFLAILIRQDFIINALFRIAWLVPWSTSLWFRKIVAKVYCYGGVHSGAAVTGTFWWTVFTGTMAQGFFKRKDSTVSLVVLTMGILLLLGGIIIFALPSLRERHHNMFEMSHRFLGWAAIMLFWVQVVLLSFRTSRLSHPYRTPLEIFFHSPTTWLLLGMTLLMIYPWLYLRWWTFTVHPLSNHAVRLSFSQRVNPFACLYISTNPLREWHPFATFPSSPPAHSASTTASLFSTTDDTLDSQTSLLISSAGSWTRALIHRTSQYRLPIVNSTSIPLSKKTITLYTRLTPRPGVLSLTLLFRSVLILTTGSGIAPVLSSLLYRPRTQRVRVIWSARDPQRTYGAHMLELLRRADPEARIIDTALESSPHHYPLAANDSNSNPKNVSTTHRRSDRRERNLIREIMYEWTTRDWEAVFVLANKKATGVVVRELEGRGVRVWAPIWDS